jgi:hypothetical protein
MTNEITAEQIANASSEDLKKIIAEFRGQPVSNENTDCYDCTGCKSCTGCNNLEHCKYMICNVQLTADQYFAAVSKL